MNEDRDKILTRSINTSICAQNNNLSIWFEKQAWKKGEQVVQHIVHLADYWTHNE